MFRNNECNINVTSSARRSKGKIKTKIRALHDNNASKNEREGVREVVKTLNAINDNRTTFKDFTVGQVIYSDIGFCMRVTWHMYMH